MEEKIIAAEVYKKRRNIDANMYAYQCYAAKLRYWNMFLIGIEMVLFTGLFLMIFLMPQNTAAIGIAAFGVFILYMIHHLLKLDKMEAEARLKGRMFGMALEKLDRQIDTFKLDETPFQEQVLWLDHLFLLENFAPFSMKKWYYYQASYTRNKEEWKRRMRPEGHAQ